MIGHIATRAIPPSQTRLAMTVRARDGIMHGMKAENAT
jgi:hypothetical protein